MITALRRRRAAREGRFGDDDPLAVLADTIAARGRPGESELPELADSLGLPVATLRGVLGFYDDLHAEAGTIRVCRGTSCRLEGGARFEERLARGAHVRGVYCLGACDRGPVARASDGRWMHADTDAPGEPEIRCLAPEPIVTRRLDGRHVHFDAARAAGVYDALARAVHGPREAVVETLLRSGERGRGGAAYPTGEKWARCAAATGDRKVVVANGDEGDPGSFIDRWLLERDPHGVLEGLLISAYAVGADEAILFIRGEYPDAVARMRQAVSEAVEGGCAGHDVLGSGFRCDVSVRVGLGSYVCGEETALLNAIEGLRGEVRLRPPYPVVEGLFGRPTVVNNVETLVNVAWILAHGAEAYAARGTKASNGTKALCLNRGFARPGILEVEFGTPLARVVEEAGGGREGTDLEALILGGPMGSLLLPHEWDVPVCYDAMRRRGIELGHGGLVALRVGSDLHALLVHALEFMADESCGKCLPCGRGSGRALEIARGGGGPGNREALRRLLELVRDTSLCGFGKAIPGPILTLLERWGPRALPEGPAGTP